MKYCPYRSLTQCIITIHSFHETTLSCASTAPTAKDSILPVQICVCFIIPCLCCVMIFCFVSERLLLSSTFSFSCKHLQVVIAKDTSFCNTIFPFCFICCAILNFVLHLVFDFYLFVFCRSCQLLLNCCISWELPICLWLLSRNYSFLDGTSGWLLWLELSEPKVWEGDQWCNSLAIATPRFS